MGGGKGKQEYTVGFRYYASVHMVLCHGPVGAVTKMIVGDKTVWSGAMTDGGIWIDLPDLFGGEDGEGGIAGAVEVLSGAATQPRNGFLAAVLGGDCPGFRGVVSVILENFMLCSMNPYPKPWRFAVRRFPSTVPDANVTISGAFANPAQIIAECLVNQEWGLGVDTSEIDMASFRAVATTLAAEGFGLCARWDQTASLEDFLAEICRIIDGQLQMDPTSGQYSMRLIREDYSPAALKVLGPSNILALTDFSRPDPKELINEVVVVFEDWRTGIQQSVTEKDTAALALNPAVNSTQFTYQAIPTQALARRVALRELSQGSSGLARCSVEANREAAGLMMGDCFRLNWPPLGIDDMVMRITRITQGSSGDWRVRLDCVQDIYGLPDTAFSEVESGWSPPDRTPRRVEEFVLYELPYYMVAQFVTGDSDSAWADQPPGFGYLAVAARQPSGLTVGFRLELQSGGQWEVDRGMAFTEYGTLPADIDDVQTSIVISEGIVEDVEPNSPLFLDGEWMLVYSYDRPNRTLNVGRGCLDTVPAAHAAGATVWLTGMYNNASRQVFVSGQWAYAGLTAYSSAGDAARVARNMQFANRAGRPVAPANVRVNGAYRPKALAAWASTLQWSRRDRTDTARIRPNTDGDVAPEDGTTARVVISEMVFPDSAWTAASDTQGLDGVSLALAGLYTPQAYALRFALTSRMGSLDSLQANTGESVHTPWIPELKGMALTAPPGSPARGDCYAVPAGATGAWAGHGGELAKWVTAWRFHSPAEGQRVTWAGGVYERDGESWTEVADG
jgi:hypothetical protein